MEKVSGIEGKIKRLKKTLLGKGSESSDSSGKNETRAFRKNLKRLQRKRRNLLASELKNKKPKLSKETPKAAESAGEVKTESQSSKPKEAKSQGAKPVSEAKTEDKTSKPEEPQIKASGEKAETKEKAVEAGKDEKPSTEKSPPASSE